MTDNLLSREAILGADDIETETVAVPEWGGSVLVRGLTGKQRGDFETSMVEGRGRKQRVRLTDAYARLVALCIVDTQGNRVFSDADVELLGQKSGAALNRVWQVASRLSGLSDEDMEELVGNSASAPNGASPSASPSPSDSHDPTTYSDE